MREVGASSSKSALLVFRGHAFRYGCDLAPQRRVLEAVHSRVARPLRDAMHYARVRVLTVATLPVASPCQRVWGHATAHDLLQNLTAAAFGAAAVAGGV